MDKPLSIRNVLWQLSFQFKVRIKQAVSARHLQVNGMHMRLLHLLADNPQCSANQLSKVTGRDKAQITRLVKELEQKALVQRRPNPSDKRGQLLMLSEKGRDLSAATHAVERQVEDDLLHGLSEDEIATFIELANRMLANLRHSSP